MAWRYLQYIAPCVEAISSGLHLPKDGSKNICWHGFSFARAGARPARNDAWYQHSRNW